MVRSGYHGEIGYTMTRAGQGNVCVCVSVCGRSGACVFSWLPQEHVVSSSPTLYPLVRYIH